MQGQFFPGLSPDSDQSVQLAKKFVQLTRTVLLLSAQTEDADHYHRRVVAAAEETVIRGEADLRVKLESYKTALRAEVNPERVHATLKRLEEHKKDFTEMKDREFREVLARYNPDGVIREIREALKKRELEVEKFNSKMAELEQQLAACLEKHQKMEAELSEKVATLERERDEDRNTILKHNLGFREKAEQLQELLTAAEGQIDQLAYQIRKAVEDKEEADRVNKLRVGETEQQCQAKVLEVQTDLEEKIREIKRLKSDVENRDRLIEDLNTNSRVLLERVFDAESSRAYLQNEIVSAGLRVAEADQKIDKLKSVEEHIALQLKAKTSELEAVKRQSARITEELMRELQEVKEGTLGVQDSLRKTRDAAEAKHRLLELTMKENQELQSELQDLRINMAKAQQRMNGLTAQVTEKNQAIKDLEMVVAQQKAVSEKQAEREERLVKKVGDLEHAVSEAATKTSILTEKLRLKTLEMEQKQAVMHATLDNRELQTAKQEVAVLQSRLKVAERNVEEMRANQEALINKEAEERSKAMAHVMEGLENQKRLQGHVEFLQRDLGEKTSKLDRVLKFLRKRGSEHLSMMAQIDSTGLQKRFDRIEAGMTEMHSKLLKKMQKISGKLESFGQKSRAFFDAVDEFVEGCPLNDPTLITRDELNFLVYSTDSSAPVFRRIEALFQKVRIYQHKIPLMLTEKAQAEASWEEKLRLLQEQLNQKEEDLAREREGYQAKVQAMETNMAAQVERLTSSYTKQIDALKKDLQREDLQHRRVVEERELQRVKELEKQKSMFEKKISAVVEEQKSTLQTLKREFELNTAQQILNSKVLFERKIEQLEQEKEMVTKNFTNLLAQVRKENNLQMLNLKQKLSEETAKSKRMLSLGVELEVQKKLVETTKAESAKALKAEQEALEKYKVGFEAQLRGRFEAMKQELQQEVLQALEAKETAFNEFRESSNKIVAKLKQELAEMKQLFMTRPSKMEDLRQIHELKRLLGLRDSENEHLRTTNTEFGGLLASREGMYNKMFNANPFSGVYDPVAKENVVGQARLLTEGELKSQPTSPTKASVSTRKRSMLKTGPFRVVNRKAMGATGLVWEASEKLSQSLRTDHLGKGFWKTEGKLS